MDEVAFQEEVVAVLKKSLEGADVSIIQCSHVLLYTRLHLVHNTHCQIIVMGVEECH